jgi:hypothetical protein
MAEPEKQQQQLTLPDDVLWIVRTMLPVVNSQRLSLSARSTAPLQTEWIKCQLFVYFPDSRDAFDTALRHAVAERRLSSFWEWVYAEVVFPATVDPVYNSKECICDPLSDPGSFDRRDNSVNNAFALKLFMHDDRSAFLHRLFGQYLRRMSFIRVCYEFRPLSDTTRCWSFIEGLRRFQTELRDDISWKIILHCARNHVVSIRTDKNAAKATCVFQSAELTVAGCCLAELVYGTAVYYGWSRKTSHLTETVRTRQAACLARLETVILKASKLNEKEARVLNEWLSNPAFVEIACIEERTLDATSVDSVDARSYVLRQLASMDPDVITEFATLNALIFEEFASMAQKETNEANRDVALKTYFEKQGFVLIDVQSQTPCATVRVLYV